MISSSPFAPGGRSVVTAPKKESEVPALATLTQSVAVRPVSALTRRNGFLDRYFYFAMSLVMAGIVVWGFSHTVNENLLHPAVPRPLILWFHAVVFSTWVLFFIFQSTLVRTRNVKWHRFFGWFGVGLGTVMVPLGVTTGIVMAQFQLYRLHMDRANAFLIVPLNDMVAFGTLLTLAVCWRKKPELHRRFMYIATCGLLAAAFGRFAYISHHDLFYAGVDLLILLGATRDFLVSRRVHQVYLVTLPVLNGLPGFCRLHDARAFRMVDQDCTRALGVSHGAVYRNSRTPQEVGRYRRPLSSAIIQE
jgi:hypothetical protein